MKKLGIGLVFAVCLTGAIAQGAETVGGTSNVVAGSSAPGAGEAAGDRPRLSNKAALIIAGLVAAGAVAAGSKTETTTSH